MSLHAGSSSSSGGGTTTNAVTFDNSGSGAASGTTFNGSAAKTVSTNTIGALKASNNLSDVTSVTTAALNLASETTLAQSAAQVSHTGDTAEVTLATITLAAGAMGANGAIIARLRLSYSGAGGNRTPRLKFGGTTVAGAAAGSTITTDRYNVDIINRNSQSSQFTVSDRLSSANTSTLVNGTAAIDTSASVTILITGQLANSGDTITLEGYQIVLSPKA